MIEIENHYWGTTIQVVDQKEVIGGDLGWWEQSIDVASSQYPPQLLRENGNWALRNISHGETADTCSVHSIISIGFLLRRHDQSLDRRRYQTDPGQGHPTE